MSRIVCARFETTIEADAAVMGLRREGFQPSDIDSFYVLPPGQHNLTPIGGDTHSDAGARHAGGGALIGALGALLGALIGAFGGAMTRLHGASRMESTPQHPVEMNAGRMLALNVDRAGRE